MYDKSDKHSFKGQGEKWKRYFGVNFTLSSESFKKIINKEEVNLPGLIVDFMGYAGFIMGFSLVQIPGVIHAMFTFFASINFRKSGKKVDPVMLKHRMQHTPHHKEENRVAGPP